MIKRTYVWEFPVRLTHWINVLSIVFLVFTGIYIASPFIEAFSTKQYIMGTIRFLHFTAAYFLTVSFLLRIYWGFKGNQYANWKALNPLHPERTGKLIDGIKFYLLIKKDPPTETGHTATAVYAYLILFFLFILEILSGFALYSVSHIGWQWTVMGGWVLYLFDLQTLRLWHHLIMWLIISFAIAHVYIAWFVDRKEKNGVMSSIFSGYKSIDEP